MKPGVRATHVLLRLKLVLTGPLKAGVRTANVPLRKTVVLAGSPKTGVTADQQAVL